MKDKIIKKINSREWKFSELLKLREVASQVAEEIYQESTATEQLQLIWETEVNGEAFGSLFKKAVMQALDKEIIVLFQDKFENATVNFDNQSTMAPPPPMPVPPPPPPETLTEKYPNQDPMQALIKGEDIELDLKERDGKVKTRAGSVKVKRVHDV